MDRYDPYTDSFLRDTQYNILGTNLAEVGTDVHDINVGELISRQAAIDAVKRLSLGETDAVRLAMRIGYYLERLQSAQPKRGKWILDRSGAYCCSECMEPCATYVMMKPRDKFCKMCGSRNEVTE